MKKMEMEKHELLEYIGDLDKRISDLDAGSDQEEDIEVWFKIASVMEGFGRYEKAVEYYQKIIKKTPYDMNAWFKMGVALRHMGSFNEALKCYSIASKLHDMRENEEMTEKDNEVSLTRESDITKGDEKPVPAEEEIPAKGEIKERLEDYEHEMGYEFEGLSSAIEALKKVRGGAVYYKTEPTTLLKTTISMLDSLVKDYRMSGVVVNIGMPSSHQSKIIKKQSGKETVRMLSFVDAITKMSGISGTITSGRTIYLDEPYDLESIEDGIQLGLKKVSERALSEEYFVLFDDISALQAYNSPGDIKKFVSQLNSTFERLNLYGFVMVPKGKIDLRISDVIRSFTTSLIKKLNPLS